MKGEIVITPVAEIPATRFGNRSKQYREAINEFLRLNTRYAKMTINGDEIKVGSIATGAREQLRNLGLNGIVKVVQRESTVNGERGVYLERVEDVA